MANNNQRLADLANELQTQGWVRLEAFHPGLRIACFIAFGLSAAFGLGGIVLLVLGLTMNSTAAIAGLVMLLIGGIAVLAGWWFRRRAQRSRGNVWTLDARGITINQVGPVPWSDLAPVTWRMEPAIYSSGLERVLVMPLTSTGYQRALGLHPAARKVLNGSTRDTLLTGPQPLESIRVRPVKGLSGGEFSDLLNWARGWFLGMQ